jgi:hypothetical protein
VHQLIEPGNTCHTHHRIDWRTRTRTNGTGKFPYCVVCTLGYQKALSAFDGDEDMADAFVADLRRNPPPAQPR